MLVEHFEELLNGSTPLNPPDTEPVYTNTHITVTPPTIEEIRMAIRQIKSGKAAAPDNIPTEALKSHIELTSKMPNIQFRKIQKSDQLPTNWKGGYLVKIIKKGLGKYENYRGITLLSVPGKFFNSVIKLDKRFSRRPTSR
ncbi:unnamed protein product [Schistosoma curassoni]|uniref:Retrovirus-related Pol polyprotein from type-1 retrotransposable element R1 n=1 Tax=Schistosoma curassoni TaxID=6186 RepID=A0A183KQF4_9TREM|nr:unnamed protein product [Schistosoma curassoni]